MDATYTNRWESLIGANRWRYEYMGIRHRRRLWRGGHPCSLKSEGYPGEEIGFRPDLTITI